MNPRHAILKAGQSLYRNDVPFQFSETVGGGLAHARFIDDGAKYTAGPMPPTVGPSRSGINLQFWLKQEKASGPGLTLFAADPSFQRARLMRAGDAVLQVTDYPLCQRIRVQARLKYGDTYNAVEVCIPNVKGLSRNYNTGRNGQWAGHVQGTLPDGRVLFIFVQDAKEKFPCGYRFEGANLYLTLYANLEPKNVSREGVDDLLAMHTGPFSTSLPPEYVEYLKSDPDVKQAAQEITATDQGTRQSDTHLSLEFWLSIGEAVYPQAPLILLDDFSSPIWSKPNPGVQNDGLQAVEKRILDLAVRKLGSGPRGSLLYGDFPEQPNSFYRVRGNNHYFWTTLAWRSVLRSGNPQWYAVARAFSSYLRDSCWLDGQQDHGKGLLPWSGPRSTNGHWVDSEALLMAWLVDGDAIALAEYQRWMAAFVPPTTSDRESEVAMRMCRVAFAYTGDQKWKTFADGIDARIRAALKSGQAITGAFWHPLAFEKPLGRNNPIYENILNVPDLAATQKLDDFASFILYGKRPLDGKETGFGPLDESYVGLQLEAIYDYYRGRQLQANHRIIYGVSKDGRARLAIEKTDDKPSTLRIALGSRGGDIPGTLVEVYGPDGSHVTHFDYRTNEAVRFPRYPLTPDVQGVIDGFQVVQKSIPFEGPAGRYQIEVWGHSKVMLHGPLSKFPEWQDTCGEFSYEGQDASGEFPLGSVMVGQ